MDAESKSLSRLGAILSASASTLVIVSSGAIIGFGALALNSVWLGLSPQAWATVAVFISALISIAFSFQTLRLGDFIGHARFLGAIIGLAGLVLLVGFQTILLNDFSPSVLQPTVMLGAFLLTLWAFAIKIGFEEVFFKTVWIGGLLGSILGIVAELAGSQIFLSGHSTMALLLPLAVSLRSYVRQPRYILSSGIIFWAIIIGNSRMVIAIATLSFLLFVILIRDSGIPLRFLPLLVSGSVLLANVLLRDASLNRFLEVGDQALVLGLPGSSEASSGLTINTNGRLNVWGALLSELRVSSLFFGRGPGFSAKFVGDYAGWAHPHNEYIRLLVDSGVFAPILLVSFLSLAITSLDWQGFQLAAEHFPAFMGCVTLFLLSLTDLPLVAFGVAIPVAATLGLSWSGGGKPCRYTKSSFWPA